MAAVVSTLIELDERSVARIPGTKVKVIEVATDKLDVHFISSLPVMQRTVCKVWADTRPVRITRAES